MRFPTYTLQLAVQVGQLREVADTSTLVAEFHDFRDLTTRRAKVDVIR